MGDHYVVNVKVQKVTHEEKPDPRYNPSAGKTIPGDRVVEEVFVSTTKADSLEDAMRKVALHLGVEANITVEVRNNDD